MVQLSTRRHLLDARGTEEMLNLLVLTGLCLLGAGLFIASQRKRYRIRHTGTLVMAKDHVSDSYRQAGYTGVQTLGGIGFTWEHDMQLYFRRGSGTWSLFGDPNWHRERLLQSIKI